MRTWIKLYTEILRDPKMGRLTGDQGWACVRLFLLAGTIDEDGRLGTLDDLAWHLRANPDDLAADLAVLAQLNIMEQHDDGEWYVVHFGPRQERAPSAEPEAVAERVKRHREKERAEHDGDVTTCNEGVTSVQRGVTPSDSDQIQIRSDSEADSEIEAEAEQTQVVTVPVAAALSALLALPDMDADVAGNMAKEYPPPFVIAWAQYAGTQPKLANPAGYAVKGIRSGREPPAPRKKPPDDGRRYVEGEYAAYIQH